MLCVKVNDLSTNGLDRTAQHRERSTRWIEVLHLHVPKCCGFGVIASVFVIVNNLSVSLNFLHNSVELYRKETGYLTSIILDAWK